MKLNYSLLSSDDEPSGPANQAIEVFVIGPRCWELLEGLAGYFWKLSEVIKHGSVLNLEENDDFGMCANDGRWRTQAQPRVCCRFPRLCVGGASV